jgi:transcriptional regulator with XRE-family HTH domain
VVLRGARRSAGLSQAELAGRVGTSRSRLSAYESGSVVPSVELFFRLVAAAGAQCHVSPVSQLGASEERSLRLHQAIAERLVADPDVVLAKAKANVATMRAADTARHAAGWLERWDALLECSLLELVDVMLSRSQVACDLRQTTPFAGVLSPAERLAAMGLQQRAS